MWYREQQNLLLFKKSFVYKGFLVWGRHFIPAFSRHVRVSRSSDAMTSQTAIERVVRRALGSICISLFKEKDSLVRVLRSVKKNSDRIGELLFQKVRAHVSPTRASIAEYRMRARPSDYIRRCLQVS